MAVDSDSTYGGNASGYRINSLKGVENYSSWSVQMTDILNDVDLLDYVDGTIQAPEVTRDDKASEAAYAKWRKRDRKALTQIRLRVSPEMIMHVEGATTSKDAWDALASTFKASGPMAAILDRRKLYGFRIQEGGNIEEHIRLLRGYQQDLSRLGAPLSDDDFVSILLTAMPDSWNALVSVLSASDNLNSNKLIAQILAEDHRLKSRDSSITTEDETMALYVRKTNFRKGVTCYYCDKEGHIASVCRGPKRDLDDPSEPSRSHHTRDDANDVIEFHVHDSKQTYVAPTDQWLADSATQSHIVCDRSLFSTYRDTPGGTVSRAGTCTAQGRGTVPVIFKVDGRNVPATSLDVIYAPDVPSNLISLGRVTDAGFTIGGSGSTLSIRKDNHTIAVGHKTNHLYQLDVVPARGSTDFAKSSQTHPGRHGDQVLTPREEHFYTASEPSFANAPRPRLEGECIMPHATELKVSPLPDTAAPSNPPPATDTSLFLTMSDDVDNDHNNSISRCNTSRPTAIIDHGIAAKYAPKDTSQE